MGPADGNTDDRPLRRTLQLQNINHQIQKNMITLTADTLHETFLKCLFKEGEPTDNPVIAEGVMMKIGFHPGRLKEKEELISQMLYDLPNEFQQSGGGGMSFLNACNDKEGNQWADLHRTMDELLCLGIAIGKARILFPRDLWSAFPGGMPYFVVLNSEQEAQECDATMPNQGTEAGNQNT